MSCKIGSYRNDKTKKEQNEYLNQEKEERVNSFEGRTRKNRRNVHSEWIV